MVNGDGSDTMVFLVTRKALPADSKIHVITVEERSWEGGKVKVSQVDINFTVLHGITIIKVPPGKKAWCSGPITEAFLRAALFRVDEHSILQVGVEQN